MTEAKPEQKDRPHDPSLPEKKAKREQKQRNPKCDSPVVLAGRRVQNMPAIKLGYKNYTGVYGHKAGAVFKIGPIQNCTSPTVTLGTDNFGATKSCFFS